MVIAMPEKLGTVLFLTIDFPPHPGGMSRHCLDAALALSGQGYKVAVITADAAQSVPADEGIEVIRIKGLAYGQIFDDYAASVWRFIWEGMRYCRRHRVKFSFANTWTIAGVAAMAIRFFCGVPYAVFAHGLDVQSGAAYSRTAWLMQRVFACARAVIANSLFTRELVSSHAPADKVTVAYPVAQERRLSGGQAVDRRLAGKRFMLTVARLAESKGIDTVIRTLPEVVRQCGDVYYAVVGAGSQEAALRALAEECGVADRVVFAGRVADEDLGAYYASCAFFIMTSTAVPQRQEVEGFGIVFLEAALFSKPAVGSRCGGIPEAVADGETGFVVDSADAASVTGAIARLFNDRELAAGMGRQARRRAIETFNIEGLGVRLCAVIGPGKKDRRV